MISFKAKNKVVTRNKNKIKIKGKDNFKIKTELTPRGQLHEETVYGKENWSRIELNHKISKKQIDKIRDTNLRAFIKEYIKEKGGIINALPKGGKGIRYQGENIFEVTVNIPAYTKRIEINKFFTDSQRTNSAKEKALRNIFDLKIRDILKERVEYFNGDFKKAFSNLDENPIWLNKGKGISIKRVTISGVSNVEALHAKKDHNGNFILDENGNKQPVDFVSTGNNHHVAIYKDQKDNLQEEVVSFYKAVSRINAGLPVINKNKEGLEFLFTMKQNEYFIFPSDDFDPNEIDLLNSENAIFISPHLFRVQKLATKDYVFRHHLETTVGNKKELNGYSYKRLGLSGIVGIVKVRINHLGQIVKVGEY